jgi:diaminopimelate decarboxylase
MNLPSHLSVLEGHLCIGGHDTVRLVSRFGTPLYVTDQQRLLDAYRAWVSALTSRYRKSRVLYAAKANGNAAILRAFAGEGAGADVFSSGELRLAQEAGMNPRHLLFNGSSKSSADLALAVEKGVPVSVDSLDELHQLDAIARKAGRCAEISFRVNPAIDVPTHPKIATGLATSKFGIAHERIPAAYREALGCSSVKPIGVHCHIGSQILEIEPFVHAARVMVRIARELTEMGVELEFIDLGGGLGIAYRHGIDRAPTPDEYAAEVVPVFLEGIAECGISPELWIEPGRSLVGDSTILLTTVNSVKQAHKTFVNVDAGFNLLIRPVMYDAYHEVLVASRADEPSTGVYTIAGPICETGDLLARDRSLPAVRAGDLIAVLDAGAYGFAMSSQYNSRPRCAECLVNGPEAVLMRRAEDLSDITAPMQQPPWQR